MRRILRSLVLVMIVLMSVLMMYLPYQEFRNNAVKELNERQALIAKQTAISIESFFAEQRKMLKHFAHHPIFIHFSKDAEKSIIREYENSSNYIKAITLYDDKGVIKYSYPSPEKSVGVDISAQAHVRDILNSHKPNISDVFMAVQGFQAVAISEPVFDNAKFVGVIAFLIDFRFIAKNYLESIRIGDEGYAWMISRDGTELYCPVPGHTGANVHVTSKKFPEVIKMADSMMRGESGAITYSYDMVKGQKVDIVTKYAVYRPIKLENNFWSIVVATPEKEILYSSSLFMKKMTFAMLLMLVAIIGYVLISVNDYNLEKRNEQLQELVDAEIAKRRKQEQIMLQQARFYSMTDTLNAIAHQWRQPLNSIGLCVQNMEEAFENDELTKEYMADSVDKTIKSLESLSGTIDNFSRFFYETGKSENVDILKELQGICEMSRVSYDAEGITIRLNVSDKNSEDEFNIHTYPDKLKQVVVNCLNNSKEAIESLASQGVNHKGRIIISLKRIGDNIIIEIIDNGGGIDESILDKIFDPYFTTKDVSIGMGQGLYISKTIMEENLGGSIDVDNYLDGVKVVLHIRPL